MYKLKQLSATNFKGFDQISVSFSDDIMYCVGGNGSGKSTLGLDILWSCMQGVGNKSISKDMTPLIAERYQIIGDAAKTAKTSITLHDTVKNIDIKVSRKILRDGTELHFDTEADIILDQKFLNDLWNIYLVSPKRFLSLTPREQSVALGIDLSDIDKKIKSIKENYTLLNRQLKELGTPQVVEKVDSVDVTALVKLKNDRANFNTEQEDKQAIIDNTQEKLDKLIEAYETDSDVCNELSLLYNRIAPFLGEVDEYTTEAAKSAISLIMTAKSNIDKQLEGLKTSLPELDGRIKKGEAYINALPKAEPLLDITELDNQIASASSVNVKAAAYKSYLETVDKREKLIKALEDNKAEQSKWEEERTLKIRSFNLPFEDISISEEGELLLKGRFIKEPYFSAGELIRTVPVLILASMKSQGRSPEFPYVFVSDFSLLDEDSQAEVIEYFRQEGIQACFEVVSKEVSDKPNSIFLKDNVIIQNNQ